MSDATLIYRYGSTTYTGDPGSAVAAAQRWADQTGEPVQIFLGWLESNGAQEFAPHGAPILPTRHTAIPHRVLPGL